MRWYKEAKEYIKRYVLDEWIKVPGDKYALMRNFKVTPEKAKALKETYDKWGETGKLEDAEKFDKLFDFGWDGDTLDFYIKDDIATVVVTK